MTSVGTKQEAESDTKRTRTDTGPPARVFPIMEPVYEPADTSACLAEPPADRPLFAFAPGAGACDMKVFSEVPLSLQDGTDVVVVHGGGCKDGLVAAAIVRDSGYTGPILAWSLKDGDAPELKDKDVTFVDCCPEQRHLKRWGTKSALIIDHHPRARELSEDPHVVYMPDHCGASLLRWWLGAQAAEPFGDDDLVRAAVAGDTWAHAFFPDWDVLYDWMDAHLHARAYHRCITCLRRLRRCPARYVTDEDRARTAAIRARLQDLAGRVTRRTDKRSGQVCWLVPCDDYTLVSRLGEVVVQPEERRLDIAVMHTVQQDGRVKLMARAHVDSTLEMARKFCVQYGGEGHGNAAGCTVTKDEFATMFH